MDMQWSGLKTRYPPLGTPVTLLNISLRKEVGMLSVLVDFLYVSTLLALSTGDRLSVG